MLAQSLTILRVLEHIVEESRIHLPSTSVLGKTGG